MKNGYIHIKTKRRKYKTQNTIVRLRPDAYNTLVDICNDLSMDLSEVASEIILQSTDLIVCDEED